MANVRGGALSPLKLGLAALLMVLLSYKLWVAASEGLAELYVVPASALMDSWEDTALNNSKQQNAALLNGASGNAITEQAEPFVPPREAWDAVLNNLQMAAKLSPKNPIYQDELARLLLFKLYDSALDVPEIESTGVEVVTYLQHAAYYRPTWPYHWMDIAYTQYQLYRYHTDIYRQALRNTAIFGPWLHDTQHFVTDLALDTWNSLDEHTRVQSLTAIERALQSRPEKIEKLIESKNGWNTLCSAVMTKGEATNKSHPYPNITNNCPNTN